MRRSFGLAGCAALLLLSTFTGCGGGCGSDNGGSATVDGAIDGSCAADAGARLAPGQACGCNTDCPSGFCVDGVCCQSACTEACKTCNGQGAPGICTFVPNGVLEQSGGCPVGAVSTCGLDGTCDGQGHCRKYPEGTECKPGTCTGVAVSDVNVCDGQGGCRAGPATICAPFNCDPATNKCASTCKSNTDCASGILCVNGSCGLKPNGAVCAKSDECKSTFCADGVCCNVACKGPCVSCDQQGRGGTCWPTDVGSPDPHSICAVQAPATCGTTGACDGVGGCARFAAQIRCTAPACSGDRLIAGGTCDGLGTCLQPPMMDCTPYRCADGACINRCASDNDCVAGRVCQAGSCGKKLNGQPCTAALDCASNHCVDAVCCDQACTGACRSCALPTSLGSCRPVANGDDDMRNMCVTQPASTCGTDGKCDGAGGCRRHRPGTVCAPERCASNRYTPESTCSATGTCVAPNDISCVPYACNGSKCFGACALDANCSPGRVCSGNSCGLKPPGAFCSAGAECMSGNCAQGVCCASACASACRSCALSGTMGTCTNVPVNSPDPAQTCVNMTGTCLTNGRCAAGACQVYAQGTPCGAATCPASGITLTPASTCDGAGTCVTPPASSCFPFKCGVAMCRSTCASDADCAPPNVCINSSCGLRPFGAPCVGPADCQSGLCAQGVCCMTACNASCVSCALVGNLGTCKPIAAGDTDPKGQCSAEAAATCGRTGFCDGSGGCQLHAAGTQCAPPSCPTGSTTATLPRTCDGNGTCRPSMTQSCGAYACNGTTCNAACGGDSDCAPGRVCNAGSCGLKRLGQLCAGASECESGNCVEGVCCGSAVCGNCQSCNVTGMAGMCNPVGADEMEPHGGCTPNPPCGFNGKCDGNGACRNGPTTTSCGTASCSGSTLTPVGNCNGAGACVQPPMSCAPFACGAAAACRTTCTGDGDCAGGFTCMSSVCTNLKANGAACVAGTECFSGNCTEGFCCASASCTSCNSCAVAGKQGTCQPVPANEDPKGDCMSLPLSSCMTTGSCDGSGQCATYPTGTNCMPATCAASQLTVFACDVAHVCTSQVTPCAGFLACDSSSACKTSCADPADCAAGYTCNAPACEPL